MKTQILTALVIALFFISCKDEAKKKSEVTKKESVETVTPETVIEDEIEKITKEIEVTAKELENALNDL
ncbi:hypothetical protein ACFLSU_05780 [Bacteroidota bacterium]